LAVLGSYTGGLALPGLVNEVTAQGPSLYKSGDLIAGKYELESMLGRGGMGAVWRAQNVALGASVAIKILTATGERASLRERLKLEAKVAASVTHPAIVKVFDVGETGREDPFIVMELLNGTSLGGLLTAEGRLPATRAVQILLPIAEALQLAHSRGLVHRDVKPDNIFIVHEEGSVQPKLLDFGIVKIRGQAGETHLTRAGDVLGSPDYLSPEQAQGRDDVDHLSDVWAFSVVLFEAIAGRVPFDAPNYNALVRQIIEVQPPALHELAPVDERISAIVARGMSKQRGERYGSMVEMGRALAAWLHQNGELQDLCGTSLERKWLRASISDEQGAASFGISSAWLPEYGSGSRKYDRDAATEPPPADAAPHSVPPTAAARTRARARVAAVTLIPAALGFGLVAWHQTRVSKSAKALNATATELVAKPSTRQRPRPQPEAASSGATPPPLVSIRELPTLEEAESIPSAVSRQRRASPARPAHPFAAPAPRLEEEDPQTDLIKPY
jgi:serine/threonine-protein kinase